MVNYNATGLDISGITGAIDAWSRRKREEELKLKEAEEVGAFGDRLLGTIATSGGSGGGAPSRAAELTGIGQGYSGVVAGMESGGRYDAVGPTHAKLGRALGKYQVMEANVGPWTEKHLGRRLTGDQFLADREAQEAVFKGQFGEYASKHGPANALSMWHSGKRLADVSPTLQDRLGTRTVDYVNRGMAALGHKDTQPVTREASTQPIQTASRADADIPAQGATEAGQFNLPGGRGAVAAGGEIDPQRLEILRQGIRSPNPQVRAMAMQEIQAIRAKQMSPTEYKFEKVGDELVRIDPRRGTVEPAYRGQSQTTRNLMTPEERAQFGVDPNYRGPVQVDSKGTLHFPGKVPEVPKPEAAYDKARGEEYAGVAKELREGEGAAIRAKNALRLMESLTKDPNFYSGAGGDLVKRGKQALVALGVANPEAASPAEVFQTMANELTMGKLGGKLGAGVSNTDVSFIQQMSPNLTNTPVGNRLLIDFTNRMMDRQIEVAKMAREFAKGNGGRLGPAFDDILSDYSAKNPLFGPADIAAAQEAAQAISPKSSGLLEGLFGSRGQPAAAPAAPAASPSGAKIIRRID